MSGEQVLWLYVVRRRVDGRAVYCGCTADPRARWYDHVARRGVLADVDPDDLQLIPVHRLVGTRREAYAAERRLTEALLAAGEPLRNANHGGAQRAALDVYRVASGVYAGGGVYVVVQQGHGAELLDRLGPDAHVETEVRGRRAAWAWVKAHGDGRPVFECSDQVGPLAAKARRRAAAVDRLTVCTDTGDAFTAEDDAAAWAGCTQPAVHRALSGSGTAGGLHWAAVDRGGVPADRVHAPAVVRMAAWLPPEHVDPAVVAAQRRPRPRWWTVDGRRVPGDAPQRTPAPAGHRWLVVIHDEDAGSAEVGVHSSVGQAWSTFIAGPRFVRGHAYTVTAELTPCTDRAAARRMAAERRAALAEVGVHVHGLDRASVDRRGATQRANCTKARRGGAATVCLDTGAVFVNPRVAAEACGLTAAAVYNVVNGHVATAGGLRWARVPVDRLPADQRSAWEAALAGLADR